jgi:hypothetical protein
VRQGVSGSWSQLLMLLVLKIGERGVAHVGNVFAIRDLSNVKEECTIGSEGAEETVDALGAEEGWSAGEGYLWRSQVPA